MHSAFIAATAPVAPTAEGKPAMGLQQAAQADQPLHISSDKQQAQAAPGSETQAEPFQAIPPVNAASATLLAANTDAVVADGKATQPPSAPVSDTDKLADAGAQAWQQSQPDTQKSGYRMDNAPSQKQFIADIHQGSEPLASASQKDQRLAVSNTNVQGSRHRAVTPSGSRQAEQHQQHPRRRREFHDEPKAPGPGRKRSQTPEVDFGGDVKRSRNAWHPTPALARHAGHAGNGMLSQGVPKGPSSFSTRQGSASLVAPTHRYRDSQSPTPRSAGRESEAGVAHDGMAPFGRHAHTTRSMSMSPSRANSGRNPLPRHHRGGTPGPHAAPHASSWDSEVHNHSRGNAPETSVTHLPRFDHQQHGKASWSNKEYNRASLLPFENNHHRHHYSERDRRSRSTDRAAHGRSLLPPT